MERRNHEETRKYTRVKKGRNRDQVDGESLPEGWRKGDSAEERGREENEDYNMGQLLIAP